MQVDNCVLMVVDVQNGFVTDATRHILPLVVGFVDRWEKLNGATVYSRYFNYPGSAFECHLGWEQLYGPPDTDIVNDLLPYSQKSTVFDKRSYSALTPEFEKLIHHHGWTDVLICGIDTDLCVLKTALDVFEHGLTSWVITNASASTGGETFHESGLRVIGRAIGKHHLLTVEDLCEIFA